jgi:hypothetical protein
LSHDIVIHLRLGENQSPLEGENIKPATYFGQYTKQENININQINKKRQRYFICEVFQEVINIQPKIQASL